MRIPLTSIWLVAASLVGIVTGDVVSFVNNPGAWAGGESGKPIFVTTAAATTDSPVASASKSFDWFVNNEGGRRNVAVTQVNLYISEVGVATPTAFTSAFLAPSTNPAQSAPTASPSGIAVPEGFNGAAGGMSPGPPAPQHTRPTRPYATNPTVPTKLVRFHEARQEEVPEDDGFAVILGANDLGPPPSPYIYLRNETQVAGRVIVDMTRLVTVHPSQKLFFELVWDDDLGGGTSYSRYFAVVPDSAEAAGLITQPEFDDGKSVFAEQTGSKTGGGGLNGGDDNPSGGTTTTLTPVPTFTDDSTPIGLPSTTTSVGADPGLGGSAAEPGTSSRSSSKLSTGAIAGIAVAAALVGLGLLAALIFCLIRRRRRNNLDQSAISPGGYGNHTPELIAQKEANASVGVEVSPHSPYSDDGGAAHAVGAGGMLQHSSTRQEEMPLAGYRERDMHGSVGSREVAGLADGESLRGSQTGVGRETPTAVRHLVEDGMTEDEIRRLEEEERELDQAIEQAGGGRR